MSNQAHIDRRKQPQNTIKAIEEALAEIAWPVDEIASFRFMTPSRKLTNESFGYFLKVPQDFSFIRKFWLGYLSHQAVTPGIYAGMDPVPAGEGFTPLKHGYRKCPFNAFTLLKQVIPQKKIIQMEKAFGTNQLKEQVKKILVKTYPFSLK